MDTTNKIVQALKCVGVRVLDHIIVGLIGIAAYLMLTAAAAL
ncbi:JAB domain-containing protein [Candidatus Cryosericum terrychapinii]|uniref:RadC-like JAB domain-containing protein n=1 Tax=Candidatus Cryosericum terrychapinii TaxID=2290919 RepID=A0A398D0N9_9BACT|nr:hypothetical protein SMC7_05905 [Candidatus Cryosericum terrychapinii]